MLQWAHSPWNLKSPEAATAWPVTMAAQPAKKEEAGGRYPCHVWKTSQLSGALGKWGRDSRSIWVTLARQDWAFHSSPASLSYHAPWFGVSTGPLRPFGAWISPSRTGHPESHCGTQPGLISGAQPEHPLSQCTASREARDGRRLLRGPGTCCSDITSSLACRVHYTMAMNV
jgi:hypothetical protein